MPSILLVDDHDLIREGLKHILSKQFPSASISEASTAEDAIKKVSTAKFDLVISDLTMPGRGGLDVVRQVKQIDPKLPVLILSMHAEDEYAVRALKAGAAGYLNKTNGAADIFKAIKMVLQGRKYISPAVAEKLAQNLETRDILPHSSLSDREFYIFKLIAEGKSVSAIAEQLSLGLTTVSTHRARILHKMGFKTNADLTKYAIQYKLL
jgi:two-component system invasion response regulator UvrY